jgi:hypothetical protein
MSEAVATLKLEAVGRIAERLLREVAAQPGSECFFPINDVASELREIVDAVVPSGRTPTERAMAELALWSRRHACAVEPEALEGAMFAELVSLQIDAGRTRGEFLSRCARAYDSLSRVRAALDAVAALDVEPAGDAESSEDQG